MTGITGTQYTNVHPPANNPNDFLRPSRMEIYLDPDPRMNLNKVRFGNNQHASISNNNVSNDSDLPIKPSPQSKRLAYGDNFTHFPNI